jgi:polysaccharide biosynthesis protein PslG
MTVQVSVPAWASHTVNSRFFGMHVPTLARRFPPLLRGTVGAVNLSSDGVYWPRLEPSRGRYTWTRLDEIVQRAHRRGARPLLVLGQTPHWARRSRAAVPPSAAWKHYVRKVVKRYGTRLDYEIWPEPNVRQNWTGSPWRLARLTVTAARIIHSVARRAVVVSPAMVTRLQYERTFMDKFFAAKVDGRRVGRYVDAVGLDLYPLENGSPEDSMTLLRQARTILRSHGVSAPVWNVEINYGVVAGGQSRAHRMTSTKQAAYVVRTYVLNAAAHVRRVYWLLWGHSRTLSVSLATRRSRTRAGTAYLTVASWLNGQHVRPCVHSTRQHLYSCKLVEHGHASRVYWTTSGRTVVRARVGARFLQTATGHTTRAHGGQRLTITPSPVWVHR